MSIFSRLFGGRKPAERKIGDCTVKLICTDRQLELFDEIFNVSSSKYESILNRTSERLNAVESKIDELLQCVRDLNSGDFGKIAKAAGDLAETERFRAHMESLKRESEFMGTRRDISDAEKENMLARLLVCIKQDADNMNLRPEIDGGISDDYYKMYNVIRSRCGMDPVEAPKKATWDKIVADEIKKRVHDVKAGDFVSDMNEKTSSETGKIGKEKPKRARKGTKNGKNAGRNRKAKATGSGDAVSTDKKLADGQG